MKKTLRELKEILGGTIEKLPPGNSEDDISVDGASGLQTAKQGMVSFYKDHRFKNDLLATMASCVIAPENLEMEDAPCPVLRVKDVDLAFNRMLAFFARSPLPEVREIHEKAIVHPSATLGENVHLGPYTVVEENVEIGPGTVVFPFVYIGRDVKIGSECVIWPGVTIREEVIIGNRVIIHPNSVIGSDGFGFAPIGDRIEKLPQIGTVLIEDEVEIGAGMTIDRARFDKTVISYASKLDNLIHIAHNVRIGSKCMIAAQTGIAGSTVIGDGVQFGGQTGVNGHISVGSGVRAGGKAGITRNQPDGITIKGNPARNARQEDKGQALIRRLPDMRNTLKKLEERVRRLEENAEND